MGELLESIGAGRPAGSWQLVGAGTSKPLVGSSRKPDARQGKCSRPPFPPFLSYSNLIGRLRDWPTDADGQTTVKMI